MGTLKELMSEAAKVKLTDLCRACLKNKTGMKFLFDNTKDANKLLAKFQTLLNCKVELDIESPSHLCKDCEKKLNSSFEFKEQCMKSNELIHQYCGGLENQEEIKDFEFQPNLNTDINIKEDHNDVDCVEASIPRDIKSYLGETSKLRQPDRNALKDDASKIDDTKALMLDCIDEDELTEQFHDKSKKSMKLNKITRNNTNQRMRLKQYAIEDVERAIKTVREKLYRHVICTFCKFNATSSRALSAHVTRVHREYKGKWCSCCNELIGNLDLHNETVHCEDLKCPFCDKILSNIGHFMEHMASHSGTRFHKCNVCHKSFISRRHLRVHHDTHLSDGLLACNTCKKRFLQPKILKAHICTKHEREHPEDVTQEENNLNSVQDTAGLNIPVDNIKQIEPQNYCKKCDKKVRSLQYHNDKCHSVVPLVIIKDKTNLCSYCGKCFRTSSKLNVHIRTHTGEKPYKCRYCDRRLKTRNILVMHERTHTGEKPYRCNECGKSFAQSSCLNTHLKIHTGRPEQCTICEKRFCRPAELRLHMRKHTGEKPYNCDLCNRGFVQKSHLVEHRKRHSKDRPFKCNFCEKAFKTIGTLKDHLHIHTGIKPFKCSQCSYICRKPYMLTQHMRQHSSEEQQANHPNLRTDYERSHIPLDVKPSDKSEPNMDNQNAPTAIQFASENIEFLNQTEPVVLDSRIQIQAVQQVIEIATIQNELDPPKFDSMFEFTVI